MTMDLFQTKSMSRPREILDAFSSKLLSVKPGQYDTTAIMLDNFKTGGTKQKGSHVRAAAPHQKWH